MSSNTLRILSFAAIVLSFSSVFAAPPQSGAEAVVAQLYRDFAWEAVVEEPDWPGHSLLEQPRETLSRYFDDTLSALILKDRACVEKTREVCRLDFSPIWSSQDPAATELHVASTKDPSVVRVTFKNPGDGQTSELTYRMVRTPNGWRVHDIVYHSGPSLLAILRSGT